MNGEKQPANICIEGLVKILLGDPGLDVFDHLRNYKRNPGPRLQKLQGPNGIAYFMRREPTKN